MATTKDTAKTTRMRLVLQEAEARYRSELLDVEERAVLWSRIVRLRRRLENQA